MTFNEYQERAWETAIFQHKKITVDGLPVNFIYPALGLAGEAGEVAEKIKKFIRDGYLNQDALVKELGDVLWYLMVLAKTLDISGDELAEGNIKKLADRKERGVLTGAGDER